ncbi:MAG: adenylate/guanylate cyclase domain-containing protein [Flavobacteriales bacterium]|nr:hypothetical protein [Flavobacteriales bacterium]
MATGRGQAIVPTHNEAWADSILSVLKNTLARDPSSTIAMTDQLVNIYSKSRNACALAEVNGLRSTSFSELGKLDSSLACVHRAMAGFRPDCDSLILIRTYVASSYLQVKLKDFQRVDSICMVGLSLWNPTWRPTVLRNALLTNRAIAAARQGDLPNAEARFRTILQLAKAEGAQQDIDDAIANIGAIKGMRGQLDSAEYYGRISLARAIATGKKSRIASWYTNLAVNARSRGNYQKAIVLSDSALIYAILTKDLSVQAIIHGNLASYYHSIGDLENAYKQSVLQYNVNDSLLNEEKVRALAEMQAKYESVKQDKEISALRAENLQAELDNAKMMRTRNVFLFVALAVLGVVFGLLSRLRYIGRSRKAMQKEKVISEELLHNILPEEVADEIRAKGYADVHEFENATILFTDFKDFTVISETMSAPELVGEIDHCFKAFDGIVEKHGIEKIKTIGDAYMAAGGLPDKRRGSPLQTVHAALEMHDFMQAYKQQRIAEGRQYFVMRTGLHTGSVIAGIVGVKKYAYDIWGDTVNVANRMETSGEVAKVNISQTTYDQIRNEPGLRFTPRGAVPVKGKGMLNMFFVERV